MDEARRPTFKPCADWLRGLFISKPEGTLKEVIEEAIEGLAEDDDAMPAQERVMLHNVLAFGECTVSEIMIPRTDIVAVAHDITLEDLKAHIIEQRHTRTPVYEDTLDHILGFLHVKDLLPMIAEDKPFHIRAYLRTMPYVPPSMKVVDLLARMRAAGSHMAIVVDEHGGTDGLVTLEDVVEEIVGDIQDEHDEDELSNVYLTRMGDKIVDANARVRIEQLERFLERTLVTEEEAGEFDTLAGLVSTTLGRVPAKGEMVPYRDGMKFEILDADPRRIRKVRLHLP